MAMSDAIDYTDLLINGVDPDKINQIQILSDQITDLRNTKKEFEDAIEAATAELSEIMLSLDLQKVQFPQYSVVYGNTTTRTINPDGLKHVLLSKRIDQSVIAEVMEEAVKVTVSASKAKIYPKRSKE